MEQQKQHARTMITFSDGGTRFNYRVGAIILHDGRVLCQRAAEQYGTFWFVLGGRAELRESAIDSLRREIVEEVGIEPTIGRLLYVLENFFVSAGEEHHELGLYFLVTFPPDSYLYKTGDTFTREEDGQELTFAWLPLNMLEQAPLYPAFFQRALQSLPEQAMHVVHRDQ